MDGWMDSAIFCLFTVRKPEIATTEQLWGPAVTRLDVLNGDEL
jgi:hypothetical protein